MKAVQNWTINTHCEHIYKSRTILVKITLTRESPALTNSNCKCTVTSLNIVCARCYVGVCADRCNKCVESPNPLCNTVSNKCHYPVYNDLRHQ